MTELSPKTQMSPYYSVSDLKDKRIAGLVEFIQGVISLAWVGSCFLLLLLCTKFAGFFSLENWRWWHFPIFILMFFSPYIIWCIYNFIGVYVTILNCNILAFFVRKQNNREEL